MTDDYRMAIGCKLYARPTTGDVVYAWLILLSSIYPSSMNNLRSYLPRSHLHPSSLKAIEGLFSPPQVTDKALIRFDVFSDPLASLTTNDSVTLDNEWWDDSDLDEFAN